MQMLYSFEKFIILTNEEMLLTFQPVVQQLNKTPLNA
jgi:hypothetical protein